MIPELEQRLTDVEALCRRFQVRRLDTFGSAASGGFRDGDSDLDFLAEFQSPAAGGLADRYFGLLEALEQLFQRPVDLVVESAIRNPYFRESIERSRALLYAA